MKKKILALLMVLILSFTMCACQDKEDEPTPSTDTPTVVEIDDENLGTVSDEENYIEEGDSEIQYLNPDELKIEEQTYSEDCVPYDFGLKIASKWNASAALNKVDYSNLEALTTPLETTLKNSLNSLGYGTFETWSEYEDYSDDDDDGIDHLVYAMGLVENDTDKEFCELGVLHNNQEEDNYQYIVFYTKSFNSKDSFDATYTANAMSSDFGVTVKESTLKKAFKTVWEQAEATDYDYTIYETKTVKGSDYVEKVTFSMNSMVLEDGSITAYAAVERERNYN